MTGGPAIDLGRCIGRGDSGIDRDRKCVLGDQSGTATFTMMRLGLRAAVLLLSTPVLGLTAARAQDATSPPTQAPPLASSLLQSSLRELGSTIAGLHIAKWKAPGPVKDEAQGNAGSIERDLQNALPALLSQADAAPLSVAGTFAVYRNLDALYEVLLRVSGTAELAAPDEEAANLAHSLLTLDAGRRSLADSILSASRVQEAALLQARQPPVVAPPPAAPTKTVVDDGPAATPSHRKAKARPKAAPQATSQM